VREIISTQTFLLIVEKYGSELRPLPTARCHDKMEPKKKIKEFKKILKQYKENYCELD